MLFATEKLANECVDADKGDQQGEDGKWNNFTGLYDWDAVAICCDNPEFGGTGGHKEGEDFTAAPNLDHNCQRVKQVLSLPICSHHRFRCPAFRNK